MNCAWKELMSILPPWIRAELDRQDTQRIQELRFRINAPPELIGDTYIRYLNRKLNLSDLQYCINAATQFSPWVAATQEKGYITAPGGHRIGICGYAIFTAEGKLRIQQISSICIRVARDFPGIARKATKITGSILIFGAPGWGKTTLLRDLARVKAETDTVCVADERCELFPDGIALGKRMDVLSGCPKSIAVELLLRTMGPEYIAVDEITAREDCDALLRASNCGVNLLATAHGTNIEDYMESTVYRSLREQGVFTTMIFLQKDKTYRIEGIRQCT